MKSYQWVGMIAVAASLSVAACDKKAKEPTGQVIATVDGEEITSRELKAEMATAKFPNDAARKAAEQQALQAIINRHVLAKAARERGIDKTPDYAIQREKAEQVALITELQNSITKSVPPSSAEEAKRYIIDHPDIFAQRKIFSIDQIRIHQRIDPKVAEEIKPLTSIDQVAAVLTANNVPFQRAPDKLDSVGSDPKMIDQIVKMKPGDMFAVPMGQMLLINQVTGTQVQPFEGDQAVNYAIQQLTRQHTQEAMMREYGAIMAQVKDKVQYSKGYAPPPQPKAAPAATNAPAPATNAPAAK